MNFQELRSVVEAVETGSGHYNRNDAYRAFEMTMTPELVSKLVDLWEAAEHTWSDQPHMWKAPRFQPTRNALSALWETKT